MLPFYRQVVVSTHFRYPLSPASLRLRLHFRLSACLHVRSVALDMYV